MQSADLRSDVFVTWADFSGNFHLSVCIVAANVPTMQAHRDQHRLRCTGPTASVGKIWQGIYC